MNIKVKYDKNTGEVRSLDDLYIGICMGIEKFEDDKDEKVTIDEVVKLKEAGFTSEEIIEMHKKGVV